MVVCSVIHNSCKVHLDYLGLNRLQLVCSDNTSLNKLVLADCFLALGNNLPQISLLEQWVKVFLSLVHLGHLKVGCLAQIPTLQMQRHHYSRLQLPRLTTYPNSTNSSP